MTAIPQKRSIPVASSPRSRSETEIPSVAPELESLTTREHEIARYVAMGFSNKEVARMLEISHWTVAAHLKATFLKLGVRRRAELAYLMRRIV